ncbi:MAG: acyltransferase [Bacteroidia bacterium]|jgi:acetyltransferase-like isoleucine patch superfamily enzyme
MKTAFLFPSYWMNKIRHWRLRMRYAVHPQSTIGAVKISGKKFSLGKGSYMNSGYISAGNAGVNIGAWCAIGYNVSIIAVTHDIHFPTGLETLRPFNEKPVHIGDGVWIGNNVVILPGCTIGNFAVIGANSVVNRDIPDFAICVGMPARVVKIKEEELCRQHVTFVEQNKE